VYEDLVTTRAKNVLGLLVFAVVAALALWWVRRSHAGSLRALDAVPADAFLVIDVDVDVLRRSPLAGPILDGPPGKLLGGKTLVDTCGFDPVDRLREVAVAVPVEDDTGEFGVAVRADVTKDELVDCARKVLEARGVADRVSFRQSGSFTWVEPEGDLARRYPTLAYREGGPYLIAKGAWLGTMVDTAEGKLPSAGRESRHLALRRDLETDGVAKGEGKSGLALLATVLLPKAMREHIKSDMGKEIAEQPGEASSAALMAGVLGVEAAGLGISAGDDAGGEARALLELHCEDEAACSAVARIIDKTRREWENDRTVLLLGVGPLLDNLTVESRGKSLRVATHAPAEEVGKWVGRVLELRSGRHPTGRPLSDLDAAAAPVATHAPPPSSDERVSGKDAGSVSTKDP
jgi:hypothetical protein